MSAPSGIGPGGKDHDVSDGTIGDEILLAVDDPLVAVQHSRGLGGAGIAARFRLGQPEGADFLALGQGHQVLLLLLLVAKEVNGRGGQRGLGDKGDGRGAAGPCDLLHGDGIADAIAPHPPVLLGKGQAEEAQLAHLAKGLHGEPVLFVYLLSDGFDLVFSKVAHHLADQFLLLVELEMHGGFASCYDIYGR